LCDELVGRAEESYRLCVSVCELETSTVGRPRRELGHWATEKNIRSLNGRMINE